MTRTGTAVLAVLLIAICAVSDALAQTTGAVFGPVVREGHRSLQYRLAFDPDTDALAQRLHYQQALDSRFMWRIIAQARKTADSDADFDFVQGELFWDITDEDRAWQTGLRFDARMRDRGRPATLGLNWTNQFVLAAEWRARLLLLTSIDLGDGARDGIALQSRASLYRDFPGRFQAGLEMFSAYGTTSNFATPDEQSHAIGPFVARPFGDGWSFFAGALFGLTGAAADADLRLWMTRSF